MNGKPHEHDDSYVAVDTSNGPITLTLPEAEDTLEVKTIVVHAKSRKLAAKWTVEAHKEYEIMWSDEAVEQMRQAIYHDKFDRAMEEVIDG